MPLNALQVKSLTCPSDRKQIKKSDGKGLFLLVKNNQSKLWRFKFKFGGKHKEISLGQYPSISLSKARELADDAQRLLMQGINPSEERKSNKRSQSNHDNTFGKLALEWWERQKDEWSDDYVKKVKRWLTIDIAPIANLPVDEIDAGHIAELMLEIEASGHPKKAPPILSAISRIFAYALAKRVTRVNPAQGISLRDIIKPLPPVKHHAAILDKNDLRRLIIDIDGNELSSYCTAEALKLIPRLFLRPVEIRRLRWEYIDFEDKLIRIPSEVMKKSRDHLVPLADQVIDQLLSIQRFTGYSPLVFPGSKDSSIPISKNVMTNLLRKLGYTGDVMSSHGFRSTAATILHEQGWPAEIVDTQLAHLIGTSTSRAYIRASYLKERKEMMQSWADFLEALVNTG